MFSKVRILHLEANPEDSARVERELHKFNINCHFRREETVDGFRKALADFIPDLIIADFGMPGFNGSSPVAMAQELLPEVPFLFVSGFVGEEGRGTAIRDGATDSFSKQELSRLGPAVIRALREAEERLERRRAEEARHESEARFHGMFDHAAIGIGLVGLEGEILQSNPALREFLGYDDQELSRLKMSDLIHPQDLQEDSLHFEELLNRTRTSYQLERRMIRKDGTHAWGRTTVSLVREKTGAPLFAIHMTEDASERKTLEAQLRQVQKMDALGRLAGGVAHDFNNVLTAIMGFSEMALDQITERDPVREMIQEVFKAGERAKALTGQLLAFSRKQTLKPETINFNAIVANVDRMLRRLIGEHIDFRTDLAGDLGNVKADKGQIEQVIVNLAVNSRDAMFAGGKLVIRTANEDLDHTLSFAQGSIHPGRYVTLSVIDSGTGMDPETLAHIFEPFFTTKAKGKGTGLGLATVYGIVQQSNGMILVESARGKGTTFRIYLPRVTEMATSSFSTEPSTRKAIRGTETILIAEDDTAVRVLTFELLKRQGYQVLEAEAGPEALKLAVSHPGPIHLLLSDLGMPGMSGPELAKRLLEIRPKTRVLFMSGHASDDLDIKSQLGPDVVLLEKPFSPEVLSVRVRAALDAARVRA